MGPSNITFIFRCRYRPPDGVLSFVSRARMASGGGSMGRIIVASHPGIVGGGRRCATTRCDGDDPPPVQCADRCSGRWAGNDALGASAVAVAAIAG